MRKQRIKGMISWIFVLAVLGTVVFFRDSAIAFYCVVFWFLIPFISTALNLYIRKNLKMEIFCPASAEKGKEQDADIFVENRGKLPVFHSFVRVQMKNRLTKEMTERDIEIPTVTEKRKFFLSLRLLRLSDDEDNRSFSDGLAWFSGCPL